jgi:hypothetical protein
VVALCARRRTLKFAIFILLSVLLQERGRAQSRPLWHFNLKQVGYGRTLYEASRIHTLEIGPRISFLGTDSIVAAFATSEAKQPPLSEKWTLHLIKLDASTGSLQLHKTISLEGDGASIFVSADNQLIVCLGTTVLLLSSEFQTIHQRELSKSREPHGSHPFLALSPSGETLFVGNVERRTAEMTAEMLDTATLEPLTTCKYSRPDWPESISDRFAATLDKRSNKVMVSEFCKQWKPIAKFDAKAYPTSIDFLNDDTLILGVAHTFTVLQRNGTKLNSVTWPKDQQVVRGMAPRDGRQFAVEGWFMSGPEIPHSKTQPRIEGTQLTLYDIVTGTEGVTVKIKVGVAALAISPDGRMAAAMADEDIQLFALTK